MRGLFRANVQALDGVEDTQPYADGVLPDLIKSVGFADVCEARASQTATGPISIMSAHR